MHTFRYDLRFTKWKQICFLCFCDWMPCHVLWVESSLSIRHLHSFFNFFCALIMTNSGSSMLYLYLISPGFSFSTHIIVSFSQFTFFPVVSVLKFQKFFHTLFEIQEVCESQRNNPVRVLLSSHLYYCVPFTGNINWSIFLCWLWLSAYCHTPFVYGHFAGTFVQ